MIPPVTEKAVTAISESKTSEVSRRDARSADTFPEHFRKLPPSRIELGKEASRKPVHETRDSKKPSKSLDSVEAAPAPRKAKKSVDKAVGEGSERPVEERDSPQDDTRNGSANGPIPVHIMPATSHDLVTTETASVGPESQLAPNTSNLPNLTVGNGTQESAIAKSAVSTKTVSSGDASLANSSTEDDGAAGRTGSVSATTTAISDSNKTSDIITIKDGRLNVPVAKEIPFTDGNTSQGGTVSDSAQNSEQKAAPETSPAVAIAQAEGLQLPTQQSTRSEVKQTKAIGRVSFARYLFSETNSPAPLGLVTDRGLAPGSIDESLAAGELIGPSTGNAEEQSSTAEANARGDANPMLTPSAAAQAAASTLPPTLRRHMESHNIAARATSSSPAISDAQQARLLQRISRAFRTAEEKGGEIKIRLSPPELGSMKLELSLTSGVLTAKLEVESQHAQTILLDSLPQLRERLAEQGIRVEKFDVNLQQRDSGGQQPQQQSSQPERNARSSSATTRVSVESSTNETRTPQRTSIDATRLNVIV